MCGYGKSQASARHLFERVFHSGTLHVQVLTLTCPSELRQSFYGLEGSEKWTQALRFFVHALKQNLGLTWAYCRSHPCGEDGKTFAPHANLLWGSTLKGGRLDPLQIIRLWRAALSIVRDPVLHISFLSLDRWPGPTQLAHACAYIERNFPGWTWPGQWARWYGHHLPTPPPDPDHQTARCCSICGTPWAYCAPSEADALAIAGLETLLLAGQPVHPAEARAWSTTLIPFDPVAHPPPARLGQQSLFGPTSPGFQPGLE